MNAQGLSLIEKMLLAYLCARLFKDDDSGTFTSQSTIARHLSTTRQRVCRTIKALAHKGYLLKCGRKGDVCVLRITERLRLGIPLEPKPKDAIAAPVTNRDTPVTDRDNAGTQRDTNKTVIKPCTKKGDPHGPSRTGKYAAVHTTKWQE